MDEWLLCLVPYSEERPMWMDGHQGPVCQVRVRAVRYLALNNYNEILPFFILYSHALEKIIKRL